MAAGYTEEDIKAAANVLAGWGIDFSEEFVSDAQKKPVVQTIGMPTKKRWAEPGSKKGNGTKVSMLVEMA